MNIATVRPDHRASRLYAQIGSITGGYRARLGVVAGTAKTAQPGTECAERAIAATREGPIQVMIASIKDRTVAWPDIAADNPAL